MWEIVWLEPTAWNARGERFAVPYCDGGTDDEMIGVKRAQAFSNGDVGKGWPFAFRGSDAPVCMSECDLICALQACIEGFQAAAMETVVSEIDIFVSPAGNFNIISLEHTKKWKNNTVASNIRHFDNEEGLEGMKVDNIKTSSGSFRVPRWSWCDRVYCGARSNGRNARCRLGNSCSDHSGSCTWQTDGNCGQFGLFTSGHLPSSTEIEEVRGLSC